MDRNSAVCRPSATFGASNLPPRRSLCAKNVWRPGAASGLKVIAKSVAGRREAESPFRVSTAFFGCLSASSFTLQMAKVAATHFLPFKVVGQQTEFLSSSRATKVDKRKSFRRGRDEESDAFRGGRALLPPCCEKIRPSRGAFVKSRKNGSQRAASKGERPCWTFLCRPSADSRLGGLFFWKLGAEGSQFSLPAPKWAAGEAKSCCCWLRV